MFSVQKPDVFKSPTSDTFVVFGEVELDNQNYSALQNAAENFTNPDVEDALDDTPTLTTVEEGETTGTTGAEELDETNIEIVMSEGKATREEAIKALTESKGDIVQAIMVSKN